VPTPDLVVRPARAGEGELLGAIGFDAWVRGVISTAGGPDVDHEHVKAQFVDFCIAGYATILVAELDGRPVGWGAREHWDNTVTDLWVSPKAQGLGVGRVLLQTLENDIARAGYSAAELEAAAVNAGGIRFYERGGYRLVWRQVKFSRRLGKEVEKVGLVKPLEPGAPSNMRSSF
jgi:[ribosomal protein S18]-alanine N-acetyltransferase